MVDNIIHARTAVRTRAASWTRAASGCFAAAALAVAIAGLPGVEAAQRGQGPRSGRVAAPIDLGGYWVSVVSEDWRLRMATPRKGDLESVPLNAEGTRVANTWDLAKDDAAGLQCKAFGIGGIMRQPGRLHVTWQDDNTLKIDFDAGTQTRLLNIDKSKSPGQEKTWQGHSTAEWEIPPAGRGGGRAQIGNSTGPVVPGGGGRGQRGGPSPSGSLSQGGTLKVVTTNFREGYLRKNGVPYSENATITEYFNRLPALPNGDAWLLVVTLIEDPKYLTQPFYTSTQFKLEPNASKWNLTPCRTPPPPALSQ
jgi:hypothetical protein